MEKRVRTGGKWKNGAKNSLQIRNLEPSKTPISVASYFL